MSDNDGDPMTLESRIAEALAEHRPDTRTLILCRCGYDVSSDPDTAHLFLRDRHTAHQAAVITALPGIAVVAVSEPGDREPYIELCQDIREWDFGARDGSFPNWVGNLASTLRSIGYVKLVAAGGES